MLRLLFELGRDPHYIDVPQRLFDCPLAMRFEKLVPQDPVALDHPGDFCNVNREQPFDRRLRGEVCEIACCSG